MRNWWNNFRYKASIKIRNFMSSRYGYPDELYRFLSIATLVLIGLNLLFRSKVIYWLTTILLVYQMFRFFSKNRDKRYNENQQFLKLKKKATSEAKLLKRRWVERENYRFRRCPQCKTVLRLPYRKGAHTVKCPKCGNEFNVKL